MTINTEDVATRRVAWEASQEMVKPIIEAHGLEQYSSGDQLFVKGAIVTKVDQNIDHILRVADWLLGVDH